MIGAVMNDWLVDTSVFVKWVLAEPDSAQALRVVSDTAAAGGKLHALDIALIEGANVIWTRLHRQLLTRQEAQQALTLLQQASVHITPSLALLDRAFLLAAQADIAVYDALFVVAARLLGAGGVTADEPLVRAAGAAYPEIKLLRNW
jgi:predicted nucleic acid-binding protein